MTDNHNAPMTLDAAVKAKIQGYFEEIDNLKEMGAQIGRDIQAVYARAEEAGISKPLMKYMLAMRKMEDIERASWFKQTTNLAIQLDLIPRDNIDGTATAADDDGDFEADAFDWDSLTLYEEIAIVEVLCESATGYASEEKAKEAAQTLFNEMGQREKILEADYDIALFSDRKERKPHPLIVILTNHHARTDEHARAGLYSPGACDTLKILLDERENGAFKALAGTAEDNANDDDWEAAAPDSDADDKGDWDFVAEYDQNNLSVMERSALKNVLKANGYKAKDADYAINTLLEEIGKKEKELNAFGVVLFVDEESANTEYFITILDKIAHMTDKDREFTFPSAIRETLDILFKDRKGTYLESLATARGDQEADAADRDRHPISDEETAAALDVLYANGYDAEGGADELIKFTQELRKNALELYDWGVQVNDEFAEPHSLDQILLSIQNAFDRPNTKKSLLKVFSTTTRDVVEVLVKARKEKDPAKAAKGDGMPTPESVSADPEIKAKAEAKAKEKPEDGKAYSPRHSRKAG